MKKLKSLLAGILICALLLAPCSATGEGDTPSEIADFASLETAFTNGGNYKLTENITLSKVVAVPYMKKVILDLNGKTLSANLSGSRGMVNEDSDVGIINLREKAKLTINDSVGTGEIKNTGDRPVFFLGGTLTLNGGTVTASLSYAVNSLLGFGKFVMTGGKIISEGGAAFWNDSVAEITGGTITSTKNLYNAYAIANNKGTIINLSNATIEATYCTAIHNLRTIDRISNCTITGNGANYSGIFNSGDINSISNCEVKGESNGAIQNVGGTIKTISGGAVYGSGIYNNNATIDTITGVNIISTKSKKIGIWNHRENNNPPGTIGTISDCKITTDAGMGIYNKGVITEISGVKIGTESKSGIYKSKSGIYNGSKGTIGTISGGTIEATDYALKNYSKITTISGGTFIGSVCAFYGDGTPASINLTLGADPATYGSSRFFGGESGSVMFNETQTYTMPSGYKISKGTLPSGGKDCHYVTKNSQIDFDAHGGSTVAKATLENGQLITKPTAPTKPGYSFGGWYKEKECTNPWDFAAEITKPETLHAKWIVIPPFIIDDNKTPIIIDGNSENIGKTEETWDETSVTIDQKELDKKLETAKENGSLLVPLADNRENASAKLLLKNIEDLAAKNSTLTLRRGETDYIMPATALDSRALMVELGATDPALVPLTISISRPRETVDVSGSEVLAPPISFTFSASYGGKTIEVSSFERFVSRCVEISETQAKRITTAIVFEEDGTYRHVPTNVFKKGDAWFANISSLTNSKYVLIFNEKKFADTQGKWYEAAVREMADRKIIAGVDEQIFAGDRSVSRAEFAALAVRALGIPAEGRAEFSDVPAGAWYSGAVAVAAKYGIVSGVGGGLFLPEASISRQEAMSMLQRAAKLAEFTQTPPVDMSFTDMDKVSDWARSAVEFNLGNHLIVGDGGKIRPQDEITRGETACVLLRLLQKAKLIDPRTEI